MTDLPEMKPVPRSTNIHSVGHDGTDLFVRFKAGKLEAADGGRVYRYRGADAAHVERMLSSPSPGTHLHEHIKNAFPADRVA